MADGIIELDWRDLVEKGLFSLRAYGLFCRPWYNKENGRHSSSKLWRQNHVQKAYVVSIPFGSQFLIGLTKEAKGNALRHP